MNAVPLSVVMPVHNAESFLNHSIESILNQTFTDFEFIILDDASTDASRSVMREWELRDKRIRILTSDQQLGLAGSSNRVVAASNGALVARMDADDVSDPDRLQRQIATMNTREDIVAVGTLCDGINAAGTTTRPRDRWRLVRRSQYIPFPHGSAMFRRDAFDAVGGYSNDFSHGGEDQDFFFKLSQRGRVVTLPETLYHFRYHASNTTREVCAARNGTRPSHDAKEDALARLYLHGAIRLWAGERPSLMNEMSGKGVLGWNVKSAIALGSASLGGISPGALRLLLRGFITTRDRLAGIRVKDGDIYDWRQPERNG